MRMKQIDPSNVRLINLNRRTLTLILKNDEIVRLKYPSEKDASSDLKQWRATHLTDPANG
jgi:hypothetical protein